MDYKIVIKEDDNGLWEAHKVYSNGESGVAFMFAASEYGLKFKLEEDGEDTENIYQENQ